MLFARGSYADYFNHGQTAELLRYIATSEVMAGMPFGRFDLSPLVTFVRMSSAPSSIPPISYSSSGPQAGQGSYAQGPSVQMQNSLCPRNTPSTTLKCHTMRDLFEFTVCETCYAEIIKPDADSGGILAKRVDVTPSTMSSGFTCQLYSSRMRQVWREASTSGSLDHLRQKVRS